MDIQSAVLNQLFVLFPVIIQGWITPVRPAGIAHGGIPQVLYDGQSQGLMCLIDPWTELQLQSWTMAVDDRVDLYINDDPTPVAGVTIKPGEEALRQRLYIPHGYLRQGVNRLHYKVFRVGGNTSEDSRDLLVLYHLRTPDNLDLVIPADVINEGVSTERAAQGVEFRFFYNNRRPYDRIELLIGDTLVTFDVPDGNAPITYKLFTDTFLAAGNNPSAVIEYIVTDQLGNPSKSPEKRLDIHLEAETFDSPILRERLNDPGDDLTKIDLKKLAGDPLLVIVLTSDARWQVGDLISVTYICKVTGQPDVVVTPPAGTVEADEFGQRKPCVVEVPNEHVIPDGAVTVTYKVHRANGDAVGSSRVAIATVTGVTPIELVEDFESLPELRIEEGHSLKTASMTISSLIGTQLIFRVGTQSHNPSVPGKIDRQTLFIDYRGKARLTLKSTYNKACLWYTRSEGRASITSFDTNNVKLETLMILPTDSFNALQLTFTTPGIKYIDIIDLGDNFIIDRITLSM
ncbi:hypothetical protein [Pseudomonas sp. Irchel 3E19]|uniref:hypothetical protein n=1 Tax=Pseudomonas sp. Irchel 3E19 TaxID=2008981 RepID=UPI0014838959|nr:hypothetical protein [Pseudomonas sp. Irchel 3E19]